MLKPFIIASTIAAAIAGAVTMASANNARISAHDITVEAATQMHTGIFNCADQVWPAIDTYCLKPASEMGETRQARLVRM